MENRHGRVCSFPVDIRDQPHERLLGIPDHRFRSESDRHETFFSREDDVIVQTLILFRGRQTEEGNRDRQ